MECSRGPACVLERLPQAVTCLLSDLAVSSDLGTRKNQLPPAAQADRQSDQVQEGRRRDRARTTSLRGTRSAKASTSKLIRRSSTLSRWRGCHVAVPLRGA